MTLEILDFSSMGPSELQRLLAKLERNLIDTCTKLNLYERPNQTLDWKAKGMIEAPVATIIKITKELERRGQPVPPMNAGFPSHIQQMLETGIKNSSGLGKKKTWQFWRWKRPR